MKVFFDVLLSRLVVAGTVFSILFVGGLYVIGRHIFTTDVDDKNTVSEKSVTVKHDKQPEDSPLVSHPQPNYKESPVEEVSSDDSEPKTVVESSSDSLTTEEVGVDSDSDETDTTNERVSPFGFGPYPEVPDGYPIPVKWHWQWSEEQLTQMEEASSEVLKMRGISFTERLKQHELMTRVGIKLWNEGHRFTGLSSSDQTGLIYPNYEDVIYVKWREIADRDGTVRRYPSDIIGSAGGALSPAQRSGREPLPDWLEVKSMEDGIEPYEFLGINR